MVLTLLSLSLLLAGYITTRRVNHGALYPFDKATTLPFRGLLALLIVSTHLGQNTGLFLISHITTGISAPVVAMFFFISGYGLCASYKAKGRAYLDGFLNKRMGKLLPSFVLLTLAMIFARYLFLSSDIESQLDSFSQGIPPLPNSWFIYAIIYVYIAFWLCGRSVADPLKSGILFTLSIIIYVVIISNLLHFQSFWYLTIILVNVGYFVALYEKGISCFMTRHRKQFYAISAAALTASYLMTKICADTGHLEFLSLECWLISLTFAVYSVVRTMSFVQWKWLCQIGVFSLELYLIHGLPLLIGRHIGLEDRALWIFTYALSIPAAIALNHASGLLSKARRSPQLNG